MDRQGLLRLSFSSLAFRERLTTWWITLAANARWPWPNPSRTGVARMQRAPGVGVGQVKCLPADQHTNE